MSTPADELSMNALREPISSIAARSADPTDAVDFHLLGVILLLSTRGDVLNSTLPAHGSPCAAALYKLGVLPDRAPQEMIERLKPFREAFATVQQAWLTLAGYENPPCPPNYILRALVQATADLSRCRHAAA